MSEQKTYETFTLNHKPELVISGLLGRREPRVRMVDTQKGPLTLTDFSIRVDLAKGDDGRYVKEAVYLNVSVRGDYKAQLVALQGEKFPRIAASGYLRATPEQEKKDKTGFWPAKLELSASRLYFGQEAGEPAAVPAGEASGAVASW